MVMCGLGIFAISCGTTLLATIATKREQFHSNVIGSDVTLFRDSVRERLSELAAYFMSHGVSDAATAQRKAIVALGDIVRVLLLLAAGLLLFTRRGQASGAVAH